MKKTFTIVFFLINFLIFAQLPILKLSSSIDKNQKLPETLDKNEVCIIYETYGGSFAHNFLNYYVIKNDGKILAYRQEIAKSYLKDKLSYKPIEQITVDEELKEKISKLIESTQLKELLKYKQQDFKTKVERKILGCMISDSIGYELTLIQNDKQSSYSYYAPKYFYEKCPDLYINKPVLKKYIDVLDLLTGKTHL